MVSHSGVWLSIELFAAERGMSCSGLARNSGLDATTFNKSKRHSREGQPRWPNLGSVAKFLHAHNATLMDWARLVPEEQHVASLENKEMA